MKNTKYVPRKKTFYFKFLVNWLFIRSLLERIINKSRNQFQKLLSFQSFSSPFHSTIIFFRFFIQLILTFFFSLSHRSSWDSKRFINFSIQFNVAATHLLFIKCKYNKWINESIVIVDRHVVHVMSNFTVMNNNNEITFIRIHYSEEFNSGLSHLLSYITILWIRIEWNAKQNICKKKNPISNKCFLVFFRFNISIRKHVLSFCFVCRVDQTCGPSMIHLFN